MAEFIEIASSAGGWGITLVFLYLMIKGDIITRVAAETLIKLTIREFTAVLRQSVRDGIRDAWEENNAPHPGELKE